MLEGEERKAEENTLLDEIIIRGINPGPAGQEKVKIKFAIAENGILEVTATNPKSGA